MEETKIKELEMKCRKCEEGMIRVSGLKNKADEALLICDNCLSLFTIPEQYLRSKQPLNGSIRYRAIHTWISRIKAGMNGREFMRGHRRVIRRFPTLEKYMAKI